MKGPNKLKAHQSRGGEASKNHLSNCLENYVSVMFRSFGSKFTNKYSEGYPGKRYYKGQALLMR